MSLLIQLIAIMLIFDMYVLIIIVQSALSHLKWKIAISKYHDRLFEDH